MKCDAKIIQLSLLWAGYQFTRGREGVDKKFDEIVSSSFFMQLVTQLNLFAFEFYLSYVNKQIQKT